MKRPLLFFLLITSTILLSCAKHNNLTRFNLTFCSKYQRNCVSINDVYSYLSIIKGIPECKSSQVLIDPITHASDTVMYLVNYEDGWEILSGDIRMPKVLIKSDSGSLSREDILSSPATRLFMENLSDAISDIQHSESYRLPDGVTDSWAPVLRDSIIDTRLIRVLTFIDTTVVSQRLRDHLMETSWGQGSPWNVYAPYTDSTRSSHCYTGCVPVAAAQVLYYLHNKIGYPETICGSAYCDTYIPASADSIVLNSADISFSDFSQEHWSEMPLAGNASSGTDKVSALMMYLGYHYSAQYFRNKTSAYTSYALNLFPTLFSISCNSFNVSTNGYSTLDSMLSTQVYYQELPVILSILRQVPSGWSGHNVVVDGYNHTQNRVRYHYAYYIIPDGGFILPGQDPVSFDYVDTYYESTYVAINWGWDGAYNYSNSGSTIWYNLYANWLVGNRNYSEKAYAVYNFNLGQL